MTARLDGSFQRIREFTLHASHELKTPLTVMHGEIETALHERIALRRRSASACRASSTKSSGSRKIVDGLTLLTKADAGQIALKLEPLRFDELVRDNFRRRANPRRAARHQSRISPRAKKLSVRGDRHRLRQLLLNLADNAVKYNQPRGTVTMTLRRDRRLRPNSPSPTPAQVFRRNCCRASSTVSFAATRRTAAPWTAAASA